MFNSCLLQLPLGRVDAAMLLHILLLAAASALVGVECISVPTGKETGITPAKVTPRPVYHRPARAPAPVFEYTQENPEPPPLDPSYAPPTYKFINALRPNSIYYVPVRFRVPDQGIPEVSPFIPKPQYSFKSNGYVAIPKPSYIYEEESKPQFHYIKKYIPFKQAAKEIYNKDFTYNKQQNLKLYKNIYPKKALSYPGNMKYYLYQVGQN